MMCMGAPKGKKHRFFTQEEKIGYIEDFLNAQKSGCQYVKDTGLLYGCFCQWFKAYHEEGEEGLASHRNRYTALHASKNLDELKQLQLRMAKPEADVAWLKKDTR